MDVQGRHEADGIQVSTKLTEGKRSENQVSQSHKEHSQIEQCQVVIGTLMSGLGSGVPHLLYTGEPKPHICPALPVTVLSLSPLSRWISKHKHYPVLNARAERCACNFSV